MYGPLPALMPDTWPRSPDSSAASRSGETTTSEAAAKARVFEANALFWLIRSVRSSGVSNVAPWFSSMNEKKSSFTFEPRFARGPEPYRRRLMYQSSEVTSRPSDASGLKRTPSRRLNTSVSGSTCSQLWAASG